MAYVYTHHKMDSGEIFYVGISKSNSLAFSRAKDKNKRSVFWKGICERHGFFYKIQKSNISWDEAKRLEISLIAKYGRRDNGTGVLCNLTDGGEGCLGFNVTQEYRDKLSKSMKGRRGKCGKENPFYGKKHSPESRKKISESLIKTEKNKGKNNCLFGKKMSEDRKREMSHRMRGRKLSEEHKKKISEGGKGILKTEEWKSKMRGSNNFFYGKGHLQSGDDNPRAKKCIFIETGEVFGSLKTGCEAKGLSYDTQRIYLNPNHKRHNNRKFNYTWTN